MGRIGEFFSNLDAYHYLVGLGFVALLIFNLCMLPEKLQLFSRPLECRAPLHGKPIGRNAKSMKKRKQAARTEIVLLSLLQFVSGIILNVLLGKWLTKGSYNYFGFAVFAPWVFLLLCRLARVDPFGHLDLFTPAYALSLIFFKIGCFTVGCCGGIETQRNFWYPFGWEQKFPIQLLEMLVAVALFFFLLRYKKCARPGTMQPVYLMAYSATRFCTEFLREESKVFLCFRRYHFFCLAGLLIGLGEYLLLTARDGRIPAEVTQRVISGKQGKVQSATKLRQR